MDVTLHTYKLTSSGSLGRGSGNPDFIFNRALPPVRERARKKYNLVDSITCKSGAGAILDLSVEVQNITWASLS